MNAAPVPGATPSLTIYTIGHSTHPIEEFIALLRSREIRLIADVRTVPKSRHNPQFNSDELEKSLLASGIGYTHLAGLGGLRHAKKDSINQGWVNASFRGFADYMRTNEFEEGLKTLLELAQRHTTAIMCAEAVPWRCHRSLIGDALLVRGITVMDIIGKSPAKTHSLTPFAKADGTTVTYPKQA